MGDFRKRCGRFGAFIKLPLALCFGAQSAPMESCWIAPGLLPARCCLNAEQSALTKGFTSIKSILKNKRLLQESSSHLQTASHSFKVGRRLFVSSRFQRPHPPRSFCSPWSSLSLPQLLFVFLDWRSIARSHFPLSDTSISCHLPPVTNPPPPRIPRYGFPPRLWNLSPLPSAALLLLILSFSLSLCCLKVSLISPYSVASGYVSACAALTLFLQPPCRGHTHHPAALPHWSCYPVKTTLIALKHWNSHACLISFIPFTVFNKMIATFLKFRQSTLAICRAKFEYSCQILVNFS